MWAPLHLTCRLIPLLRGDKLILGGFNKHYQIMLDLVLEFFLMIHFQWVAMGDYGQL